MVYTCTVHVQCIYFLLFVESSDRGAAGSTSCQPFSRGGEEPRASTRTRGRLMAEDEDMEVEKEGPRFVVKKWSVSA